jgi:hypothetical protein
METSLALADAAYAAGRILTVGEDIPAVRANEYIGLELAAVVEADAPPAAPPAKGRKK